MLNSLWCTEPIVHCRTQLIIVKFQSFCQRSAYTALFYKAVIYQPLQWATQPFQYLLYWIPTPWGHPMVTWVGRGERNPMARSSDGIWPLPTCRGGQLLPAIPWGERPCLSVLCLVTVRTMWVPVESVMRVGGGVPLMRALPCWPRISCGLWDWHGGSASSCFTSTAFFGTGLGFEVSIWLALGAGLNCSVWPLDCFAHWQLRKPFSLLTWAPNTPGLEARAVPSPAAVGAGWDCWERFSCSSCSLSISTSCCFCFSMRVSSSICLSFSCSIWSLSLTSASLLLPAPHHSDLGAIFMLQEVDLELSSFTKNCTGDVCKVSWVRGEVTISPKVSPVPEFSSPVLICERSEGVGETGGVEPVLPNFITPPPVTVATTTSAGAMPVVTRAGPVLSLAVGKATTTSAALGRTAAVLGLGVGVVWPAAPFCSW